MPQELPFNPLPLLKNPHLQTILSMIMGTWYPEPPSSQKIIALPDGDRISLEITTPKKWSPKDPTVVLIHGLCGSHRSPYLVRMAKRLRNVGIRAVRFNMRGCGSGKGIAKQLYHSGRSEDVLETLKILKEEHPDSPIRLIGYSMGANIALKLAGELGRHAPNFLEQVIAVSPPVDLLSCVEMFNQPQNAIYEMHFLFLMRIFTSRLLKKNCPDLSKKIKFFDFDNLVTAPQAGFANALEYYTKCSSAPFVPKIHLPCKILFAKDDPFIVHTILDPLELPPNVQIFKTKHGGHVGYLGNPFHKKGVRWLDSLLIDWITDT